MSRMMPARCSKRVRKIVRSDDAFRRELLRFAGKAQLFPVGSKLVREIVYVCERILLIEQNPDVISADAIAIHQHGVDALFAKPLGPFERGIEIRLGDLIAARKSLVMKIDVDRKPFGGTVVGDRVETDKMSG